MQKPDTPFPTSGYYGPEYFCDREKETRLLPDHLRSGQSTSLIAIRRLGKTGLIQHIKYHLPGKYTMIYLDILATESLQDFLNTFITAVVNTIPEKTRRGKKLWNFVNSLRPTLAFDNLSGFLQVRFNVFVETARHNIQDTLQLPEQHPKKVFIAKDEFQQIVHYPEKQMDAWLRSVIQRLKNVRFIFSGSQQQLMTELFNDPSRPFYRSTQLLKLNGILRF